MNRIGLTVRFGSACTLHHLCLLRASVFICDRYPFVSSEINEFYNDGRQKNFAGGIFGPPNNAEYWKEQYY